MIKKRWAIFALLLISGVGLVSCMTDKTPYDPPREVLKYNITFNMHEHGSAPEGLTNQTALPNPLPSVVDVEGWHFLGWYLDAEYNTPAEAGAAISANTTLHAKWEEVTVPPVVEKYNITFNMHEHGSAPEELTKQTALPNPLPSVVDVEGWHFLGWYLDAEYNTLAEAGAAISANTTLHAKWEENQYSITYNINGKGEQPAGIDKATRLPLELPVLKDTVEIFAGWYLDQSFEQKAKPGMVLLEDVTLYAKWVSKGEIIITEAEGYLEGAYVEWEKLDGCEDYNVYYKKSTESDAQYKVIDKELIREYPNNFRADVVGLASGTYILKVVPLYDEQENGNGATQSVIVESHIRSGYGFVKGTSSGAYNEDGTLQSNAQVIYITEITKNTVKLEVAGTTQEGLQNILNAYKKGGTTPLCVRFIGNITDFSVLEKGDLLVDGITQGLTIEGIGEDATMNGYGLRIKGSSNVEVRNLGFMNCNSNEGDDVGLQQSNDHIWVHNCDFFYGDAGSDADQVKGDGALDTKKSTYVTHSFNHFWDNGKCNLQGMKDESTENYITYHHNWYDHSDSRHPRIRTCTVHIYNNYFDGNAKYGVGVTLGASAFVENNYFRNCNAPMMSSGQGTDALGEGTFSGEAGGIIKAFGNYIVGGKPVIYYGQNSTSFDAYLASTRDEAVPNTIKALSGGSTYSNFDTKDDFYSYEVDTPEVARENVIKYAGRVNGGDLKWTFDNALEDSNYSVIPGLKEKLVNYKSSLIRILGVEGILGGDTDPSDDEDPNQNKNPEITEGISHNFTTSGKDSTVFTITGDLSTSKGSVTYNGLNLTQCLKLDSNASITFTLKDKMTLVLVLYGSNTNAKIDDKKVNAGSNGVLEIILEAGTHTITKGDSSNLFYMELKK